MLQYIICNLKSCELCMTDKIHQNTGFTLTFSHCLSSLTLNVFFIIGTLFFHCCLFSCFLLSYDRLSVGTFVTLSLLWGRQTTFESRVDPGLPSSHELFYWINVKVEGVAGGYYLWWEFFIPWCFYGKMTSSSKLLNVLNWHW